MSDLWINIRFGTRHFKVKRWFRGLSFRVNTYHLENPPDSWFEVYQLFGHISG